MADLRDDVATWQRPEPDNVQPLFPAHAAPSPAPDTHSVQQAAEGVVEQYDTVEFYGQRFRVAESIGMMPLLTFAHASKKGLDSDDMEGMAAMYAMLRDVIHRPPLMEPDTIEGDDGQRVPNPRAGQQAIDETTGEPAYDESEWSRFERLATDAKADGEEIMGVINQAMPLIAARPRKRRGASSASSPRTSESTRASSSLPATIPAGADDLTRVADMGR